MNRFVIEILNPEEGYFVYECFKTMDEAVARYADIEPGNPAMLGKRLLIVLDEEEFE